MAHDQPGRLSGILERAQNMQGLPRRAKCFSAKSSRRQVTRHVWQDALEQAGRVWEDKQRGNVSTPGARKPLNDPSQKPKSCMACAMPACSESATCTSSLPHRRRAEHETHRQGVSFSFFRLALCAKGLLPKESSPFVGGLARPLLGRAFLFRGAEGNSKPVRSMEKRGQGDFCDETIARRAGSAHNPGLRAFLRPCAGGSAGNS